MTSAAVPIVIGRFGKPFGIAGWIKIISFTTPKDNILEYKPWLIQKHNGWEKVYFESSKKHADNIIVKLSGCNSPEEASRFTNTKIAILREQLPELPKDEYYWSDLIGLEVINKDEVKLGRVHEIMATGANDVLVVVGERKILIPYISNTILSVDLANKIIHVDWETSFL